MADFRESYRGFRCREAVQLARRTSVRIRLSIAFCMDAEIDSPESGLSRRFSELEFLRPIQPVFFW